MDEEKGNTAPSYLAGADTSVSDPNRGYVGRIADSFKPNASWHAIGASHAPGKKFDSELAAVEIAKSALVRRLKNRHLQMIAIGGSIGTGLFVSSGLALSTGGPGALLLAFGLIGIMLFCTVHALGELAVVYPMSGSFAAYSTRFLDPAWGASMAINYAMQWLVVLPLEIVAASITLQYWNSSVDPAVFVAVFLVVIISINLFGVRGYGEAEFVFSIIKITAVVGFIIFAIVVDVGGGPKSNGYLGGRYYKDPGAFAAGFKGLCSNFVTAAFSFAGTELVGLAAAESQNPRQTVPRAIKQVFWRIALFYLIALALVGLLVPYTDPALLNGSSSVDAKASPFVIAIVNAGVPVLPSIFNAVILIAVLSVGNASIYASSRTLCSLGEQGQIPRIFAYIDRSGRPLFSIVFASSLGFLAFLVDSNVEGTVFSWMLALSGLSSIFTWGSICLCHIRFRHAWKYHGHTLDELAFKSAVGIWGSWVGFIFNCLVLIAQFWTALFPIGGKPDANAFFQVYLAAPIVIVVYIGYKIFYLTPFMRCSKIDLDTGRRDIDIAHVIAQEKMDSRNEAWWKRAWTYLC